MSIKFFFFVCYNPVELVNERFIGSQATQGLIPRVIIGKADVPDTCKILVIHFRYWSEVKGEGVRSVHQLLCL